MLCAVLGVGIGGCDRGIDDGFGVALAATFDPSVMGNNLSLVTAFRYQASGDETYDKTIPLRRTVDRMERVIYRPERSTHELMIALSAVDAVGDVIAEGTTGLITLDESSTTAASVTLYPPGARDLGMITDLSSDLGTEGALVGSPISFVTTPLVPTASGPVDVAAADFNGDAIPDVAVACKDAGKVQVFFTDGKSGTLPTMASWETSAVATPVALAAGDFTGDDRADLAVLDLEQGSVTLFTGSKAGTFTAGNPVVVAAGVDSMTAADFDGDHKLDLAFGSSTKPGVWFLYSNASKTAFRRTTQGPVTCIVAGDLNGDGAPDVITCETSSNVAEILPNLQTTMPSTFGMPPFTTLTAPAVSQLLVFDWTGDQLNDVYAFTPGATGGSVTAFTYSSGTFTATVLNGPDSEDEKYAIVADIDGDQKLDVISVGIDSQQFAVALAKNNVPPNYSNSVFYTSEGGLGPMAAARFNSSDNQVSIVAANQTSSTLALARGNASGLSAERAFANGQHPRVYDFNHDGILDVGVVTNDTPPHLYLNRNDNLGNLTGYTNVTFPVVTQSTFTDLNDDGAGDIILSGSDGTVCVALADKNKAGTFSPCTITNHGTSFIDVGTSDFDRDQNNDIVLLDNSVQANNGGKNVVVLFGDGAGGFRATAATFAAYNAAAFVVADVTGDGKLDVVVLASNGDVSVLVDGASGLAPPKVTKTNIADATSLVALHVGGKPALAVSGDTTHVFIGSTDGSLTDNGIVYSSPSAGVTAGDVDGDGQDDLIVMTERSIIVLPSAVAHAGSPLEFAAGAGLKQIVAGNLTTDSLVDVIGAGTRCGILVNNTPTH